jgi:hypothetical protein
MGGVNTRYVVQEKAKSTLRLRRRYSSTARREYLSGSRICSIFQDTGSVFDKQRAICLRNSTDNNSNIVVIFPYRS